MKKLKILAKIVAAAAFLSIVLTGCPGVVPEATPSTPENTDNPVTGPITTAETWAGEDDEGEPLTYYIDSNLTITGSLVIESGAIVKFGPNGQITANRASFTATDVIFTSYKDERGRKIQAAGNSEPNPGDWKRIYIYGGTGVFNNCEFSYGGNGCSTLEIVKNSTLGKARIDHCAFKNNSGNKSIPDNSSGVNAALKFGSTCVYNETNNSVTNSTFDNNVWPLSMPADFYIASNNTFNDNEYNYVYINDSDISGTTTWECLNIPYIFVDNNNLTIKANATLTINGGENEQNPATVCFTNGSIYINQNGTLAVNNYVKFTNCDKNPTILFKGIRCVTYRKWHKTQTSYDSTTLVYLNSSSTVTIENDEIPSNYVSDAHKVAVIQDINNYEKFKYDESK